MSATTKEKYKNFGRWLDVLTYLFTDGNNGIPFVVIYLT